MNDKEPAGGFEAKEVASSVRDRAMAEVAFLAHEFNLNDSAQAAVFDVVMRAFAEGRRQQDPDAPYQIVEVIEPRDLGWLRDL